MKEVPAVPEDAARAPHRLRESCLSYTEVLAQSVSVIAPSTVPAAVLGLIFAKAGNATWLSFLLGIFGLLLVSLNINQFARRSASPGSLYSYIVQGLGPTAGVLGGWALMWGYLLTGMSTLCGFSLVANVLLERMLGVQLPVLSLFAIGAVLSFLIAYRDIQLSAVTMLIFEGVALLLVVLLGALIWSTKGVLIDPHQLKLEGARPSDAMAGVVLVVFAFSGFESSTSLGSEAKNPLESIPRSVIQSVLIAGGFFIAMAYIVVLGFENTGLSLAESEAPLSQLAHSIGWGGLGLLIDIGVLLSFLSCTLASINSSARIMFAMASHGLVADALGQSHVENRTPHVAVGVATSLTFGVPAVLYLTGTNAFESQGFFGTLCSFGFIVVYMLISIAAPMYLKSIGKLSARALAYAVGAVLFMAVPLIGTVGIPGSDVFPAAEGGVALIAIFAAFMGLGLGWLALQRMRRPEMVAQMQHAIASVERQFTVAREARGDLEMDIYLPASIDSKVSS